ncbi:MAG TPA: GNAT family N-acetyltransferase [Gemmatimonadales bacterium]|nr:GNAT family N-acetyltransferase [Gemmatimonadales bacterium]
MPHDAPPTLAVPRTDAEILATFEVMQELRPHLVRERYLEDIHRLMAAERYQLLVLHDAAGPAAVAGYRVMEMLYCGRILSIDDLVTAGRARSRGFGARLLAELRAIARREGCGEIHLDSRLHRHDAHRFYAREGFDRTCYHFAAPVPAT